MLFCPDYLSPSFPASLFFVDYFFPLSFQQKSRFCCTSRPPDNVCFAFRTLATFSGLLRSNLWPARCWNIDSTVSSWLFRPPKCASCLRIESWKPSVRVCPSAWLAGLCSAVLVGHGWLLNWFLNKPKHKIGVRPEHGEGVWSHMSVF